MNTEAVPSARARGGHGAPGSPHPAIHPRCPRSPAPSLPRRPLEQSIAARLCRVALAASVAGCRMRPVLVWDFWLFKTVTNSKIRARRFNPFAALLIRNSMSVNGRRGFLFFFFFPPVCFFFFWSEKSPPLPGRAGCAGQAGSRVRGCRALLPSPPPLLSLNEKFNPIKKLNLVCLK